MFLPRKRLSDKPIRPIFINNLIDRVKNSFIMNMHSITQERLSLTLPVLVICIVYIKIVTMNILLGELVEPRES